MLRHYTSGAGKSLVGTIVGVGCAVAYIILFGWFSPVLGAELVPYAKGKAVYQTPSLTIYNDGLAPDGRIALRSLQRVGVNGRTGPVAMTDRLIEGQSFLFTDAGLICSLRINRVYEDESIEVLVVSMPRTNYRTLLAKLATRGHARAPPHHAKRPR
jgi:hypothetical protein